MKRKRFLYAVILPAVILYVLFASAATAAGAGTESTGSFEYKLNTDNGRNTAEIKKYLGESVENHAQGHSHVVEIPTAVEIEGITYNVTAIGDRAFENNRNITEIRMPDSITEIGKNAFNCCTNLKTVTLSNDLMEIGENAFFSCTRLSSAGSSESAAGTITLPESLTTLGAGAFYDCRSILSIEVQGALNGVGEYAFGRCGSLGEVYFAKAPSKISKQMFLGCEQLEKINLEEGIVSIEESAFETCVALYDFGGSDGVLSLPASLETIGNRAFVACMGITQAQIPNCSIGREAFSVCVNMTKATFTEENEESRQDDAPDIGRQAFNRTAVLTIELPKHLDYLEDGAFAGSGLTAFTDNDDNNDFYTPVDGVLLNEAETKLVAFPSQKEAALYAVAPGVQEISAYAFSGCSVLEKVEGAHGLKKVGAYAFQDCSALTSVIMPDTVTEMGEYAFAYCYELTDVTLPKGITEVSAHAFDGCSSLKCIAIPERVTVIGEKAFASCYELADVRIPASVDSVSPLAFVGCENLGSLDIPAEHPSLMMTDGVLYSKDGTRLILCMPGKSDSSFAIPQSVTAVGDHAFSACLSVKEVVIHENVVSLGVNALGFTASDYEDTEDRSEGFYIVCPSKNSAVEEYARKNDVALFTGTPSASAQTVTLEAGETFDFAIANAPEGSVLYTSGDEYIADVDRRSGRITGVSQGETYVVASIGTLYYPCKVTVTSGERPTVSGTEYRLLSEDVEAWEQSYRDYNSGVSFDSLDNSNLAEYTTDNYVAIMAKTQGEGGSYLKRANSLFGEGNYEQYANVAKNLPLEMSRYRLNENLVLFRGASDISQYTIGRTSRLDDMVSSIGHTFKTGNREGETRYYDDWVVSTTVDHAVSLNFGGGSSHTIVEIYAPKDYTKGAYLESFSDHSGEREILLDGGTEFKVIDAGIRMVEVPGEDGETTLSAERYMKLQIVGVQGEESRDFGIPIVVKTGASTGEDTDTGTDSGNEQDTEAGSDAADGDTSDLDEVPQTGDGTPVLLYILLISVLATIAALFIWRAVSQ